MCVLPQLTEQRVLNQLQSAAAVFFPLDGEDEFNPTQLAQHLGVHRSTIYRRAARLEQQLALLPAIQMQHLALQKRNQAQQERIEQLESQLKPYKQGLWVQVTPERLALTTLEMTARKFSVSDVQEIMKVAFSLQRPPSDGTINKTLTQGALLAEELLDSVSYQFPLDSLEFDELFHANSPILAALEPQSMSLLLLEELGNCTACTWRFAFEYRGIELPEQLTHDCSSQGNLFLKMVGRQSQLCLFHRIRSIYRELKPGIESLYKKALKQVCEEQWSELEQLESHLKAAGGLTHLLDFERQGVMRYDEARHQLLEWCKQLRRWMLRLGLSCKSLSGFELRVEQYLTHLKRWEKLAKEVEFLASYKVESGFEYLDALAKVHILAKILEHQSQKLLKEGNYWDCQELYLRECEALRTFQAKVQNNGYIMKKFEAYLENLVRTSSRIEALNRRLRGFTDSKRNVTEKQLRLMQLHHNTSIFSKDAKRAGKSPWQWLGLEVEGLQDGFVGVLKAANGERPWPCPWALKV